MPRFSEEQQAIQSVLANIGPERGERFEPAAVAVLEGQSDQAYLKKTASYAAAPKIGPVCVAIYGQDGPALDQSTTEDVVRHHCDAGVLVRRPDSESITDQLAAAQITAQRQLSPASARIVELLQRDPGSSGKFVPTGIIEAFVPNHA